MLNGLYALQRPQQPSRIGQLLDARQRWLQRPFAAYAIELERTEGPYSCFQSFVMNADGEVGQLQGDCRGEPWSVERLFDEVEQHLTSVHCAPNGCACDGRILVEASYDPQLGYPTELRYTAVPQFDIRGWFRSAFYQAHPRELPHLIVTSFRPIEP